jgi:NADH-quinone oxidoreductase subunit L
MMGTEHVAAGYVAWIPLLPLLGATVLGVGGAAIQKRLGKGAVGLVACGTVALSFALSGVAFSQLLGLESEHRLLLANLLPWIHVGGLNVDLAFAVDPLTVVMILVVTGIGGLIHVYATGYMHDDEAFWRFFAYLNLFTFAMLTLVMADNLLLMFVGWEGVGFCSWGLIGFWHKELPNTTAGNKAFIVNRVGDFGFVLGMFLLFWSLGANGTLVFRELVPRVHQLDGQMLWGVSVPVLITLFFFVGATGKSAQIPLYVWLPDAMAGPTPVSALIHAATMVTAGVYMIGRLNFLFSMAPFTLHMVAVIGALTALMAATIALAQNDIKRVLAYSTVSQLGYMFLAMGVGAYAAGIFHLMTHAFFKACLFLGSGSVIHAMSGEQDMRKMGGLWSKLPSTSKTFLVATLAIAGIPPLAGFFSKDEILYQAFVHGPGGSHALWGIGILVAFMTAFYMFRQVFMVFFGECRADHETQHHIHESPSSMTLPLWVLMIGAIAAGFLWIPHHSLFETWLEPVMGQHVVAAHAEMAEEGPEFMLMGLSIVAAVLGIGFAYLMYYRRWLRPELFSNLLGGVPYKIVFDKFYVDEAYEFIFVRGGLALCRLTAWFDLYVVDGLVNLAATIVRGVAAISGVIDNYVVDGAVNLVANGTFAVGRRVRNLQTGGVNAYLYVVLFGVLGGVLLYWSWASAG